MNTSKGRKRRRRRGRRRKGSIKNAYFVFYF
jgi:hypothetical protein